MKKILLSVFALITLASCQKDADVKTLDRGKNDSGKAVVNGNDTFITPEEAVKVAKKFVVAEGLFGPATKSITIDFDMAYTDLGNGPATKASSKKNPAYYIYNLNNKGYVIVSAHKAANPILGFSMNGSFDSKKMPIGLVDVLGDYSKEINQARVANVQPDAKTAVARAEILASGVLTKGDYPAVKPILGKIQWNQKPYYNALCPPNTPVGCVATAATQIMRHWKYPKKSQGKHSYKAGGYGYKSFDYNRTWDWDKMPKAPLRAPNSEVAELSYAVAVAVNMGFSTSGSGTWGELVPGAMQKYFNYPATIEYKHRKKMSNSSWTKMLQKELQAGRPMEYIGSGNGGGHAFVCDGYHAKGYYHFNWGWAGSSDGYFALHALNPGSLGVGGGSGGFNHHQGAVIGFAPPKDGGGDDPIDPIDPIDDTKYGSSKGEKSMYTYIDKVTVAGKEYASGASAKGYTDNSKDPFVVKRGTAAEMKLVPGFYYYHYKMNWKIWMDANKDGEFSEQEVVKTYSGDRPFTAEFKPSATYPVGKYRVRVSAKYDGVPTPFETFAFGEVEDFTIEVK